MNRNISLSVNRMKKIKYTAQNSMTHEHKKVKLYNFTPIMYHSLQKLQ